MNMKLFKSISMNSVIVILREYIKKSVNISLEKYILLHGVIC